MGTSWILTLRYKELSGPVLYSSTLKTGHWRQDEWEKRSSLKSLEHSDANIINYLKITNIILGVVNFFNKYFLMVYYASAVDTILVLMELSIKSEKQNDNRYILQTDICNTDIRENMEWWISINKLGWGILSWWSQEFWLFKAETRPKESHRAKMGAES